MKQRIAAILAVWVVCLGVAAQVVMPDLDLSVVRDAAVQPATPVHTAQPLANSVQRDDSTTWTGRLQLSLDSLCGDELFETTQLGLLVYDLTDDRPLYAINARQRMRPASCQKLVTAITALHTLGPDYQLQTRVCITGVVRERTLHGDVYIVGGMDPLLGKEDMVLLADALRREGIERISGRVCVDLTQKDDKELGYGWCWDDDYGPLSALMFEGKTGFEQPLLERLAAVGIRLNTKSLITEECPRDARLLLTLKHPLAQLLEPMMKESDNILAECLFYQLAFHSGKKGAGRKQAVPFVQRLLDTLHIDPRSYQIADGSGLSLYNYVTPELLVALLNYAYKQPTLYSALSVTLPIAGADGTLKKRLKDSPAMGNIYAKTGSVTGISSLSGYAVGGNGHMLSFCIINQGVERTAEGRDFQDKVCTLMCRH